MLDSLRLLPAAALMLVAVGCADSAPIRIEGGTTVHTDAAVEVEATAKDAAPRGRAFGDTSPMEETAATATATGIGIGIGIATEGTAATGVGIVDPNIAATLRADPSQSAAGSIPGLVTFGDLSLVGVDLDALLDYLYKPDSERGKGFEFPQGVLDRAGDDKAVVGYIIPLEFKPKPNDDEILNFMLVRDMMSCCFGGSPRPDEWVYVEMRGDSAAEHFPYLPVVVRGELIVGRLEDEYGFATGVYTMHADSVSAYAPPK